MDEQAYEKILNIKTTGEQKIFNKDYHYNRECVHFCVKSKY